MARETSETPDPVSGIGRRSLLKGAAAGALAIAAAPVVAACSSSSSSGTTTSAGGGAAIPTGAQGTVTFGSNGSDAVPKAAYAGMADAFTAKSGTKVTINTVDHNTFQQQINTYLQGNPDDTFTWFAGYRMQFFAAQGLIHPIDDIWQQIGADFAPAFQQASKGADGKYYFVPLYNYPWALFYLKSVWQAKGYTVPKTMDELMTLAKKMQGDGLVPIGFADKDGWPAMGTFDILNMRINGYQYHVDLCAHKASWTDPKTKKVFTTWQELLPYQQPGALGRTWQEAAQDLGAKKTGMYLLGAFVAQQFKGAAVDDLDFFPFPQVDSQFGQDSIDAPIDGFCMAKGPKNLPAARQWMAYLGTADAANIYLKNDPSDVAANTKADTSNYNAIQKKSSELIGNTKNIAQFFDRDARPDFAQTVMIPSLQSFINNPGNVDSILSSMESQAKTIYAS